MGLGEWADEMRGSMTLEGKVGQMMWSYVKDLSVVKRMIKDGQLGALMLGSSTLTDPEASARFTNSMQRLARTPLLIGADFEAGVGLLVRGATELPSNMGVGATRSIKFAHLCGEITAKEARAIGVHMPVAPVVDVNVNPANPIINVRSYGESAELVSKLAVSFVKGCQENRAIAVAKHFPGHGDTAIDSHRSMPVILHDRKRMEEVELHPYREVIAAGIKAIMSAHIQFPALDPTPGLPATLSHRILTGFLREEMGFEGLIVTDAMAMWAVSHNFETGEAVVRAVEAGADLVLVSDPEISYQALLRAVKDNRISQKRIEESVRRILEAKEWLGLHLERLVDVEEVPSLVGTKENERKAYEVAAVSITLVKGKLDFLRGLRLLAVCPKEFRYTGEPTSNRFAESLQRRRTDTINLTIEEEPTKEDWERVLLSTNETEAVVFAVFPKVRAYKEGSATVPEGQVKLVEKLASVKPTVVISYGSPYILAKFKQAKALLCAYSDAEPCLEASLAVLLGEIPAKGALPVTIPMFNIE